MLFFHKLFTRKTELSLDEKKEAFITALLKIEEKYISYFRRTLLNSPLELADQLQNYYLLRQEFEYIRFDYRPGSELPDNIKKECDTAYQNIWGNN